MKIKRARAEITAQVLQIILPQYIIDFRFPCYNTG